jgi:D-alanyl-lipoteichoic acid acyltransferase DltB (MBOAT superfamily)
MIFSSFEFLFYFLPPVWLGFILLRKLEAANAAVLFLLAASWVFYGVWRPDYLPLLLFSIVVNYCIGRWISLGGGRHCLTIGIVFNLSLLGVFKYLDFLLVDVLGLSVKMHLALPLAISFFTFQQIAWLVDIYQGRVSLPATSRYGFFVSFFPQLIAGPIVHAREVLPQLAGGWLRRPLPLSLGVTMLSIGLAKKVLIADTLAPGVDILYRDAASGAAMDIMDTLAAAFGYGVQLYFDFSGYADMAIGLGMMFGIVLPDNFRSPYKAVSIIEFWRRWHITLSNFLRDYLYIALGGNRHGPIRRHANLMLTMLLGGIWHGAGWQFLLWGGVHGLLLVGNHGWRALCSWQMPVFAAHLITLSCVMLAWILFRADNLEVAFHLFSGLLNIPEVWALDLHGVFKAVIDVSTANHHASAVLLPLALGGVVLALVAPGSRSLGESLPPAVRGFFSGILLYLVLKALAERPDRAFLYFNF